MVTDRHIVRRRRIALAVMVVISLCLITFSFGESPSGAISAIQRGAQETFGPLEDGASRVLKPFRDLVNGTGELFDAKDENERLEEENDRLRRELARAQVDQREAEQLRGLVGLTERPGFPQELEPVTARVIARSPTVWYSTVQIDKGSDDGIREDQPVVTDAGLAGKITQVTGSTARVTLLTDASSAVSAQVMPDGATGIVRPEVGDPEELLLDFIEDGRDLRRGTTVVTSGFTSSRLDSLFPRGIPIGRVRRVEPGELEVYQRVHVEPFADLRRMDIVRVLTGAPTRRGESSQ